MSLTRPPRLDEPSLVTGHKGTVQIFGTPAVVPTTTGLAEWRRARPPLRAQTPSI